ncbi:MAG: bifunctional malic enzyme oxidoreductase/phosphotransacetylase [Acidimicrobiia bacterium]|nr:MAG: bifunctional malic enzyme oxidoreductase/phosphotransacetylase [Acidimicrobiia bacterium]
MVKFSEALNYHEYPRPGKLSVHPTKPTATQADLSLAYTPGVAEPCRVIAEDPLAVFRFTNRGNLVAVVSNGTAVLGLGNIGPVAAKPVMEGKAVLFKRFADIDVFDLEVGSSDPDDVIRFCELLEPTVGGINLEDIKAPDCFYVEETLRERLDIPVFHDDQHGTAIIGGAAFLNAIDLTDRDISNTRVVFSGAGAAGVATARFFRELGVRPENIVLVDSRGVIHTGRDDLTPIKAEFAVDTDARTLADALRGADAFVGVSVGGAVTPDMIREMAPNPIIFALANPDPEIDYDLAKEVRPDAIVATGRSDYPNQVNNVLGFPFIFRGALDVRARGVSEGMKVAAAWALAELARQPVPESVLKAYGLDRLSFGPDYLIPKPFDPRVLWTVAPAVALAASEEGLARIPIEDVERYREELRARFQASYGLIQAVTVRAKQEPMKVVYPHGDDLRIIRAARRVLDEGIAVPVLLGDTGVIKELSAELGISLDGMIVIDPVTERETRRRYAARLVELRRHKGMSEATAERAVFDPNVFAALMVEQGDADAVLGGLTTFYPETIRPALQIIKLEPGRTIASALYVVVAKGRPYFFTDCAVNIEPTADQLAEIAWAACEVAEGFFDREPRVAFISYSDFGSALGEEPARVRTAVELFREKHPGIPADGEMQADTAVVYDLLKARRPHGQLDAAANVLVFPNLTAANAAYKLLNRLGDAEVIGPILTGLARSVHVLQRDAEVGDVVNLTAYAVADAQRKKRLAASR